MAVKPRYPVREWLGKWCAWSTYEVKRETSKLYETTLERFFEMFPKKTGIEMFNGTDVADYVQIRSRRTNATQASIVYEVNAIGSMWTYIVDVKQLPGMYNIAKVFRKSLVAGLPTVLKKKNSLSIVETLRLLDCIDDLKVKHEVLDLICGEKVKYNYDSPRYICFKRAAEKAGMPWVAPDTVKQKITNRLQKDIVKEFIDRVRQQLPECPTQYGSFTPGSQSHLEQLVLQDHQSLVHWYRQSNLGALPEASQLPSQSHQTELQEPLPSVTEDHHLEL